MIGKDTPQFADNHIKQREVAITMRIFPGIGYQNQNETKKGKSKLTVKISKNSNFIEID